MEPSRFRRRHFGSYHEKQKPADSRYTDDAGVELGARWTPVAAAGLYVPGGLAAYPSSLLMNAIPAQVAGVARLAMTAMSSQVRQAQSSAMVRASAEAVVAGCPGEAEGDEGREGAALARKLPITPPPASGRHRRGRRRTGEERAASGVGILGEAAGDVVV